MSESSPSFFLKPWLIVGALVILALGVRVFHESSESYERGVQALQDGDKEEAVFQFRTAARWVMPGFSLPEQALLELADLGDEALASCEQCPQTCTVDAGKDCIQTTCKACAFAVYCFDSGRAAILGSRGLFTPNVEHLDRMNEGLAQSLARAAEVYAPGPRQERSTRETRLAEHREQMKVDHAPAPLPSFIATLGFLIWLIGLALRIRVFGIEEGDQGWLTSKTTTMCSVVGFVVWVSALTFL